jgi:hypothetical protein
LLRHVARLVVDYFTYAARPGASAYRAAHHAARRRLLRLRRASGCLGTSRGSSPSSSSTTSPTPHIRLLRDVARLVAWLIVDYFASCRLVVDYFAYAARPGASARRTARHAARRQLLRLRRASRCLGKSRGSSRRSSPTTSPLLRVRVPRHVERLITRLVVDSFDYAAHPSVSARRAARRRLLRLRRMSSCFGTSRSTSCGSSHYSSSTITPRTGSSSTTSSTPRVRVSRHVTRLVVDNFAYAARLGASARRAARRAARSRLLRLRRASGCLGTSRNSSRGSSSTPSTTSRVQVPRHVVRLVTPLVVDYSASHRLVVDHFASRRLVVDYFAYATRPGASARRAARHRLLRLRRASSCFGTSRGSSRRSSSTTSPRTGSSSTTWPRAGSSSTTSPLPCVRVPRHVARLVTLLVTSLVVDYSTSRRLVVDYFASVARPGASARRVAHPVARRAARRRLLRLAQARRRLLRLRRASRCLGTVRGSSRRSSSTTPPRAGSSLTTSPTSRVRVPRHVARLVAQLVVNYFAYAARLGASARRAAHRSSSTTPRREGSSRGSLRRSSSTTSPTLHIRVPRHIARPVTRLIVDYSVRRDFVLRPRWLYFSHAVRRDYLSRSNTGSTLSTPRAATTSSSGRIAAWQSRPQHLVGINSD